MADYSSAQPNCFLLMLTQSQRQSRWIVFTLVPAEDCGAPPVKHALLNQFVNRKPGRERGIELNQGFRPEHAFRQFLLDEAANDRIPQLDSAGNVALVIVNPVDFGTRIHSFKRLDCRSLSTSAPGDSFPFAAGCVIGSVPGEKLGFGVETAGQPEALSRARADLMVRKGSVSFAVEIAVTTTADHAFGKVKKCSDSGVSLVAFVSPTPERLKAFAEATHAGLSWNKR
jgi:hypothetical protein